MKSCFAAESKLDFTSVKPSLGVVVLEGLLPLVPDSLPWRVKRCWDETGSSPALGMDGSIALSTV